MQEKWIWVIAGPNGAGKTTLRPHLPEAIRTLPSFNLDAYAERLKDQAEFAEDVSLANVAGTPQKMKRYIAGGETMRADIEASFRTGQGFTFETCIPTGVFGHPFEELQAEGWKIGVVVVGVDDVAITKQRVADRVRKGGHPVDTIEETWQACPTYTPRALKRADRFMVYDNSGAAPVLVARKNAKFADVEYGQTHTAYTDRLIGGEERDAARSL